MAAEHLTLIGIGVVALMTVVLLLADEYSLIGAGAVVAVATLLVQRLVTRQRS